MQKVVGAPWPGCKKCRQNEECPATEFCPAGRKRTNFCDKNDWNDYGHLAGELFVGYGTIRLGESK